MSWWQTALILAGAIGAAINGGSFFAFSNFVMPALAEMVPAEAIRSMQFINRKAPTPTFVAAIVGSGPVALPVLVAEFDRIGDQQVLLLAAAVVASIGSSVVTMTMNVPRNDRLEAVDADSEDGFALWSDYLVTWTRANTARTIASLMSVACFALALS